MTADDDGPPPYRRTLYTVKIFCFWWMEEHSNPCCKHRVYRPARMRILWRSDRCPRSLLRSHVNCFGTGRGTTEMLLTSRRLPKMEVIAGKQFRRQGADLLLKRPFADVRRTTRAWRGPWITGAIELISSADSQGSTTPGSAVVTCYRVTRAMEIPKRRSGPRIAAGGYNARRCAEASHPCAPQEKRQ